MNRKSLVVILLALALALPLGRLATVSAEGDKTYIGNTKCKVCHNAKKDGEIWTKWKAEGHSKAFETLLSEESIAIAKEKGLAKPPSEAPECLKCHVTAFDAGAVPAGLDMKDGVSCEACHGPASLHQEDGKKKKKGEEVDLTKNQHRPTEADCAKCHNAESPTWKEDRYTKEDGTKAGFDFKQAWEKIKHEIPAAS